MKNSDLFYKRAEEYQDKRKAITDDYQQRCDQLLDTKGSSYYDSEMKKATDKRDRSILELKKEYNGYFRSILDDMNNTFISRGLKPPTDEELRLIQLLKMKDSVTQKELDAAANTLKDNSTCLAILTEMAHEKGFLTTYTDTRDRAVNAAGSAVKILESSIRDFMDYDTPRAARLAQQQHTIKYGKTENAPELRKRDLFNDKAGCYKTIAGMSSDEMQAFCEAVDSAEE